MSNELLSQHFFVKLLLLFILSRFLGELFEQMKKPAMIGELLAGILLGSSVLGWINLDNQLKVIADIAVFFLVILAGLEINSEEMKDAIKGKNIWISLMVFLIPIASGILVGYSFSLSMLSSIFLGLCIAITALPVSIRLLMDIGKLNTDLGRKIVSAGAMNDILALMILGIIVNLTNSQEVSILNSLLLIGETVLKVLVFFIIVVIVYRFINWIINQFNTSRIEAIIVRYLRFFKSKERAFSFILLFILVFSSLSELVGLHMVIGTFFGALLLREEILGEKHYGTFEKNVHSISMGFLSPIFFAIIGLAINVHEINNLWFLLVVIIVSIASKVLGGFIGAKIAGHTNMESLTLGIAVNGRGLMEIVIATIAYEKGVIDTNLYSVLIIMGMVATLLTSYIIKIPFSKLDILNSKQQS
jgi:Kef-type K+ transport system membrane component KefB